MQPVGQAVLYGFLRLIRVTDFLVELSDVSCDFLLGLCLGFAGEHFAAFHSLLVKVPDHALPAAISTSEHVAVSSEPFLWHSW